MISIMDGVKALAPFTSNDSARPVFGKVWYNEPWQKYKNPLQSRGVDKCELCTTRIEYHIGFRLSTKK